MKNSISVKRNLKVFFRKVLTFNVYVLKIALRGVPINCCAAMLRYECALTSVDFLLSLRDAHFTFPLRTVKKRNV